MRASKSTSNQQFVARFDYQATEPHELTISRGERLVVLDSSREWWVVQNEERQTGYVPSNYLKRIKFNLLSSIRSAFREVLRRHDGRDISSHSLAFNAARGKRETSLTRSDPNLSDASPLSRSDWRNASFSATRSQSVSRPNGSSKLSSAESATAITDRPIAAARALDTAYAFESVANAKKGATQFASVLYTYVAQRNDELTLRRGDRVGVYDMCTDGWWRVQYVGNDSGVTVFNASPMPLLTRIGWFPSNYLALEQQQQSSSSSSVAPRVSDPSLPEPETFTNLNVTAASVSMLTKESAVLISARASTGNAANPEKEKPNGIAKLNGHSKGSMTFNGNSNSRRSSTENPEASAASSENGMTKEEKQMLLNMCEKEWYWGAANRADCERALAPACGGAFLVRNCGSAPGELTVVVRRHDTDRQRSNELHCRNFRVRLVACKFAIGALRFDSMDLLLDHYCRHPIYSADHETLLLTSALHNDSIK